MTHLQKFLQGRAALVAPLAAAFLLIALPACAQSGTHAAAEDSGAADGDAVAAVVDGETITVDELESEAGDRLEQVDMQLMMCERQAQQGRYDALNAALEEMVRERLIEQEAEKAGQSADEYRAAELDSRIAEVTDEDVQSFFDENRARIGNRTVEQVGPQVRTYLEGQARQEAEATFYGNLEAKHQISYQLEPPRIEVAATGPSYGPENAPVTIVEFSDFECPFCSRVNPTLEQVKKSYPDQVRIVFRQFPLAMHANAQKAAEASLCAEDQGKFWEMHDWMFANQKSLGIDSLKEQAVAMDGVDGDTFAQCLDSDKYAEQVATDMREGSQAGVSGTPAMFINGQMVSGAVPFEQVAAVIDAELKRKGVSASASGSAE